MSQKYWHLLTVGHIAGLQRRANDKILALLLLPLPLLLLHALLPSYLSPSFFFLLLLTSFLALLPSSLLSSPPFPPTSAANFWIQKCF